MTLFGAGRWMPGLCLAAGFGAAHAQTNAATATRPNYDLSVPVFGSNDPYSFNTTSAPAAAPSGAVSAAPVAMPDGYSFDSFRKNIHGYVSAGVATQGGHEFSGGVDMPLIPGKVDLAAGAATGQIGGFAPAVPGGKRGTLTYDQYYAAVHIHPADDFDAYVGISGGKFRAPVVVP